MSDSWIRKMYFRQKKVTKWWRVIEKLVAENIELKQKERRARRAMVNLAARYKLELEYEVPGVPWGKDDDWELWDEFVEAGELEVVEGFPYDLMRNRYVKVAGSWYGRRGNLVFKAPSEGFWTYKGLLFEIKGPKGVFLPINGGGVI